MPPSPWPGRERADVIVVGGGFTGLSAAWELARLGGDVLLFEAHRLGMGASGRNGGQVLTGLGPGLAALRRRYGKELADALFRESEAAVRHVAELARSSPFDCSWAGAGHIEGVRRPEEVRRLAKDLEAMAELGHPAFLLKPSEVAERTGSRRYLAGCFDPASSAVQPYRLAATLARQAALAGALLVEETPVSRIEVTPHGYRVHHRHGVTTAAAVLLAVNALAMRLFPTFARHLRARRSAVMASERLSGASARPILPGRVVLFEGPPTYYYVQKTPDGRLVFGGRTGTLTEPEVYLELAAALEAVFPQAKGIAPAYGWQGTICLSWDGLPHLGRTRDGCYYALGYSGHGVALSIWLGRRLARWLYGEDDGEPWRALPFPPWRPAAIRRQRLG